MTSQRKARRRLESWHRYFRKYEPWHYCTPGILRAYDRRVRASYAAIRAAQKREGS